MPDPSPDEAERLYARVRADLDAERGVRAWLRARPTPWRVGIVLIASVVLALTTSWTFGGGTSAADAMGWVSAGGLLVALSLAVGGGLRPTHRPGWNGGSRTMLITGIALASLAAIAISGDGSLGALAAGRCALIGFAVGAPIFGLSLLVSRHPSRDVVFRGLAGGLAGALAVQLMCPAPGLAHLVVEHFGVVLAGMLLFGAAGALIARPSRS